MKTMEIEIVPKNTMYSSVVIDGEAVLVKDLSGGFTRKIKDLLRTLECFGITMVTFSVAKNGKKIFGLKKDGKDQALGIIPHEDLRKYLEETLVLLSQHFNKHFCLEAMIPRLSNNAVIPAPHTLH